MTIQISLVIWTIIGFVTLSLILNRFLFTPLLKVMDARNEKIKRAEAERQEELERREKTKKSGLAHAQEAQKAAEKELTNERKKTEIILADKKAEYDAQLEKLHNEYEAATKAAEENLSERIDKLALKYVKTQIL